MTLPPYLTADPRRRQSVVASALNGIDFIEMLDSDAPTPADRQRLLRVSFLKSPPPAGLTAANFVIGGGDRITGIKVESVVADGGALILHLSAYGDFSIYRLSVVGAGESAFDPATLDPLFASAPFTFKAECRSDFDCEAPAQSTKLLPSSPPLDYLSRDYASFRQLMLDRISSLSPGWTERRAADLGVTLVELFAHVGDVLSYRQDAVATEAYLGTARRRVSVRRHARLVDYRVQEGVSARCFLHVTAGADLVLPKGSQALTALPGQAPRINPASPDMQRALDLSPEVFETLHDAALFAAHDELAFYTWGAAVFRLPQGATSATLKGEFPNLRPGDILVFEEVLGPLTGLAGDADPARRCAVMLTSVDPGTDPIGGTFETPPVNDPAAITAIAWQAQDAIPFAFQIAGEALSAGGARLLDRISVARGNIVLADHGASVVNETVGTVPAPTLFRPAPVIDGFASGEPTPIPPRFRPRLRSGPLVHAVPYDTANPPASAGAALGPAPQGAVPAIHLAGTLGGQPPVPWSVQPDVLQSAAEVLDFVAEMESDGSAWLRFGDDINGLRPAPGTVFTARYRVGDPVAGNVAADSIQHIISADPGVLGVRNPQPAAGGIAPESIEHVRLNAPFAFRTQQRAVTPADYEAAASQHPHVQRATATFRWTGSWHTIFITIDRFGGLPVDDAFVAEITGFLEPFRLAGHDLQIDTPIYVSLDIAAVITVQDDHFRSDVETALLAVFGAGVLPDGRRQVFNPDNFTFGQPVYLSVIYAAAQSVDGVAAVDITVFQRRDRLGDNGIRLGRLDFGRREIARLQNDPDFPERGTFQVILRGGK